MEAPPQMEARQCYGRFSGTIASNMGMMGYIKDDIGNDLLLVLSDQCVGFGGTVPPIGTRVAYDLVVDTGMLKAENVQPDAAQANAATLEAAQANFAALAGASPQLLQQLLLSAGYPNALAQGSMTSSAPQYTTAVAAQSAAPQLTTALVAQTAAKTRSYSADRRSGVFHKDKGPYGFIGLDSGEPEMFVMPRQCTAYGGALPPLGTRVVFEVSSSSKTGKIVAENVRPGFSGTMAKIKGSYGFITQDSGEPEIFVMPQQCAHFGENFPPIGTRVVYEIGTSTKTGKAVAEDVQPMFKQSGAAVAPALLDAQFVASQQAISGMPIPAASQQQVGAMPEGASLLALKDGSEHQAKVTEATDMTLPGVSVNACSSTSIQSFEPDAKRPRLLES